MRLFRCRRAQISPTSVTAPAPIHIDEDAPYFVAREQLAAVDDSVFRNYVDYALLRELCANPVPRPRVESISVHPLDVDQFRDLFADGSTTYVRGIPMFGVPVLADEGVWHGKVRVRIDGEDLILPMPMPRHSVRVEDVR